MWVLLAFFNNHFLSLYLEGDFFFPHSCSVAFRKACILWLWEMCSLLCEKSAVFVRPHRLDCYWSLSRKTTQTCDNGGVVSSVRYRKGHSGTPWLPCPYQIILCARSGNARAGTLVSGPCAIRLPSDDTVLSAEAMHAYFVTDLGGHKDLYYRKV